MKGFAPIVAIIFSHCVHGAVLLDTLSNFTITAPDTQSVGYRFTANEAVEVISLGYFDAKAEGLSSNHDVGLWDESGNLLRMVTVLPSSPETDGFY